MQHICVKRLEKVIVIKNTKTWKNWRKKNTFQSV